MAQQILLVASGDSRLSANRKWWPAQAALEEAVRRAAGMARELGLYVNVCGDVDDTLDRHQAPEFRA